MAQTKTSARRSTSPNSSRSRSSTRASKGRTSGRSSSGGAKGRSGSSTRKQSSARARRETRAPSDRSTNGRTTLESVPDEASSGVQDTAQAVGGVIKKAKAPLIASGVAIAGLAGAVALNARSGRRKVLGVTMPRGNVLKKVDARKIPGAISDAAKRADRFGQGVSRVANSVQMVSETADKAAKKS